MRFDILRIKKHFPPPITLVQMFSGNVIIFFLSNRLSLVVKKKSSAFKICVKADGGKKKKKTLHLKYERECISVCFL